MVFCIFPLFWENVAKKISFIFLKRIIIQIKRKSNLLELHFLWFIFSISMFSANVYPTYTTTKVQILKKGKQKEINIILTFVLSNQWKKNSPPLKIFFFNILLTKFLCIKNTEQNGENVKLMLLIKNVYLRCKKFSVCLVMFWVGKCRSVWIRNFEFWVWF